MRFTELLEKIKIKLLAPATIVYRDFGSYRADFAYCSWLPAWFIFKDEPKDNKGFYKTVYINNKRIKPATIIPRHALIEVRRKPKLISSLVLGTASIALTIAAGIADIAIAAIAGLAFWNVVTGGSLFGKKAPATTPPATTGTPEYSSNDTPSLSGAKNETLKGVVPIVFGRTFQVFNYGQYATPLVKGGYGGNRYRTWSIPSYANVYFTDFKLGDTLLSNYKSSAYSLTEAHGVSNFIGWDNAQTESFNNKELSFDQTQAVFNSAIVYYNSETAGSSLQITQVYKFENVNYSSWTNKTMIAKSTYISTDTQVDVETEVTIQKSDLVAVSGQDNVYTATKTFSVTLQGNITEYLRTSTQPNAITRGNGENNLLCFLNSESIKIGSTTVNPPSYEPMSVDSYSGDRVEILSQSPTRTKFGDIHFSFPQGLYKINKNDGGRIRTTIQAEVTWKKVGETSWRNVDDYEIQTIYVRDIDGNIQEVQSSTVINNRITRNGNIFTFKTPDDINYADSNFYECVGFEFRNEGQYILNVQPVIFQKDNYFTGTINVSNIVWRLNPDINVIDPKILPNLTQVACTFNATTQLEGDVDELGAISVARIKNIATGEIEESRNPVDVIYHLLTDTNSNPRPMSEEQFDMQSFLKAREWCDLHNCLCDGIINEEVKYETVINEIANNNQLYVIPNKWGKVVIRVDTNEDGRPIKTLFNADNSWELSINRMRGKLNRTMAIRCSYIDEETWSEQEITGYWYNGQCNWQPENGKDDLYYQPETRDLNYIRNAESVKRRIAYELEIANEKNVIAEFKIAREVLDLEVLDRVLVADYTRIKDAVTGTVEKILTNNNGDIIGIQTSQPFAVQQGMTMTIRSVDLTGGGDNVKVYNLIPDGGKSSKIYFETPIPALQNTIRTAGFYNVDGQEFYYSGDLYMAGTAEILNMVVKEIEEISGDDFTSKITCRLY